MLGGMVQAKITAVDPEALMHVDSFMYHYVFKSYGIEDLAEKYCEVYLLSINAHRKKDFRIELMRKFIGIDKDSLPYPIF